MAALSKFDIEFTRKQGPVVKARTVVYATNLTEALHLLKMKCTDFWALINLVETPDKGWLTQGRKYNAKARVESVTMV